MQLGRDCLVINYKLDDVIFGDKNEKIIMNDDRYIQYI
mgnify:CR=1 FL=1